MPKGDLCTRLKSTRESIGITKAEAARRIGLTNIGYCRYEYGERTPSLQILNVIAQCFNTSIEYLTGETDDPSPESMVISKNTEPELFEIITRCKDDEDVKKRLLKYYEKIANEKN